MLFETKLFELKGVVEVDLTEEEFSDKFVEFVESLNGTFFGIVQEYDEEDD